ncbi:MAG TPA: site-specific integrase, partial [Kofleriaceae bacterium]|nr:site-specific integrase [Kofleriaceae bacterium]
ESWLQTRPPKRRAANECHLRMHVWPFMGERRLAEVTPELVRRFKRRLEETRVQRHGAKNDTGKVLSENTVANVLRTLSKFLGDMDYPIRLKLRVAEAAYAWLRTTSDVTRFLAACGTGWFSIAAAIAAYAGLRKGEVAGLHREDIDLANGTIAVTRSYDGPTKSKHVRHAPIAPDLADLLRPWLLRHPGPLVLTVNGHAITKRTAMDKRTRAACKRAGVDAVNFHQLRHTAGSHLAKRVALPIVGAVLGHADPKTTQRYAHHDTAALAKDPRLHLSFAPPAGELVAIGHAVDTNDEAAPASAENIAKSTRSHSSGG